MEENFEKSKPPAKTETWILLGKWRGNWDLRMKRSGDSAKTPQFICFWREKELRRETELGVSLDIGVASSSPIGKSADHESFGPFFLPRIFFKKKLYLETKIIYIKKLNFFKINKLTQTKTPMFGQLIQLGLFEKKGKKKKNSQVYLNWINLGGLYQAGSQSFERTILCPISPRILKSIQVLIDLQFRVNKCLTYLTYF